MAAGAEIWYHANSGTYWHVFGNTRRQLVAQAGFTQAQIIAAAVQTGSIDKTSVYVGAQAMMALESMTVLPAVVT